MFQNGAIIKVFRCTDKDLNRSDIRIWSETKLYFMLYNWLFFMRSMKETGVPRDTDLIKKNENARIFLFAIQGFG